MNDKQLQFSDDQVVTVSAYSTNPIDLGSIDSAVPSKRAFTEPPLDLNIQVTDDFEGCTSVQVSLQTADALSEGDLSSGVVVVQGPAVALANLVAGYQFNLGKLPENLSRYIQLYYTVVGEASAGKITAGLTQSKQTNGM